MSDKPRPPAVEVEVRGVRFPGIRPVSLSVHRNTVERRRKRALAKEMAANVAGMIRENDIRAYAIIGIAADGQPHALWDTGGVVPMWAFPEIMTATLRESIADEMRNGLQDDWRPTLAGKA